MKNIFLQ